MSYLGDFAANADVYIVLDTADSTGASVTATIAVADIEVYRQNTGAIGLVQRSSTAGFTLDVDHDAMTGTHMLAIDTSDNTDAGFFTSGYDYFVKLNTVTVDAKSISKWVGQFSIENRYSAGALRPTVAGRTVDVEAGGGVGIDWGNIANKTAVNALTGTDTNKVDIATDVTNLHASAATAAAQTVIDGNVDAILVDTSVTLNNLLTDIQGAGFVSGTDSLEALQTAIGVVDAMLVIVDANVDSVLLDTGTTLDGKINAIQGATFDTVTDSLEAIRNRGDSSWVTGAGGTPPQLLQSTSIQTLASQTVFTLAAGSTDDNAYNGAVIVFEDALTSTQKAVGQVLSYAGSTKQITLVADPGIFTFAAADKIEILANTSGGATVAEIASGVWDEEIIAGHTTPDTAGDIIGRWIIGLLS